MRRDLGDFETPLELAGQILDTLERDGVRWTRVLEPTSGRGNFVTELLRRPVPPKQVIAIEIQAEHVGELRARLSGRPEASVLHDDLFRLNLRSSLNWTVEGPLLVVGNPPWVTNAELGSLGSTNLPIKSNIKGLSGLDAITGDANFDIAEYIWLKLIQELGHERPTIALLCKTAVARKVLEFSWRRHMPIGNARIRRIDAKRWFGAAVDACLLSVEIGEQGVSEAAVFDSLEATEAQSTMGLAAGELVADVARYALASGLDGRSQLEWRQGLKHDLSSVMELTSLGDKATTNGTRHFENGLGESVTIEELMVFPLLKGSDLNAGSMANSRWVIVPQHSIGEETAHLSLDAPKAWKYLTAHTELFQARKSSIYRGKPPFSVFGIGSYSFSTFKVAVSGLHKRPRFRALGPVEGLPVMLDDTCYFLSCRTARQAATLAALLNSQAVQQLLDSIVFLDNKRPFTKRVLQRVDLVGAFEASDKEVLRRSAEMEIDGLDCSDTEPWPESSMELLDQSGSASRGFTEQLSLLEAG